MSMRKRRSHNHVSKNRCLTSLEVYSKFYLAEVLKSVDLVDESVACAA